MIRLLMTLLRNLRGPWITDDPNPIPSQLDLWDGVDWNDLSAEDQARVHQIITESRMEP